MIWLYMQRLTRDVTRLQETSMHLQPSFAVDGVEERRGGNHSFYMHRRHVRHSHACCFWSQLKATLHVCARGNISIVQYCFRGLF